MNLSGSFRSVISSRSMLEEKEELITYLHQYINS